MIGSTIVPLLLLTVLTHGTIYILSMIHHDRNNYQVLILAFGRSFRADFLGTPRTIYRSICFNEISMTNYCSNHVIDSSRYN